MAIITKIRGLFRRKPVTDAQRRRREQARQAEKEILDRKLALRTRAMGIPPLGLEDMKDESQGSDA
jgi:hypothetical protein